MSLERNFEAARSKHPDISELELHFYNMKYRGIKDPVMEAGGDRPILYVFDDANFGLISFMFSEGDSPYRLESDKILFQEEELPFKTKMFVRLGNTLPYYYFRGPLGMFPSLHDDNVLNVNFHPKCGGCDFCFYGYRTKQLENIIPEQGFQRIEAETGLQDLSCLKEIAVVTGRFKSEDALKQHILGVIDKTEERGFDKRIFYIGSQLVTPADIEEISRRLGNDPNRFRYAYTVERFSDRSSIMHGSKGQKTYNKILNDIKGIKALGVAGQLEYTYIVGIEDLDRFREGAEALVPLATPHLSIIRKTGQGANSLTMSKDYIELGPDYTCQIRKHYEELYGGRIVGNNFANIWLFPLNEFNLSFYLDRSHF
ncbi:hypothetical protein A3I48_02120 [Candidatus Daviesbacteria bacterium RIFCSPLOWO2_02_FULL_36_7]|uniref:Elp3/MiaA/NifB-like radical SAM core domain-containing protein n=1 Tax=Candidatus Daviesbacteria bacterium RIFCSPLOWO2_02_FULL_36_7 TaxID=1797792 RepID=A0A1F5MI58_9BACT|nr:MAG: hypothetical protein A3I48_02120 [Candidatus Daviesbacteria bacterium RIFCSPLOWO2_02_FULL_36_7]